jgi:hypothetical protein
MQLVTLSFILSVPFGIFAWNAPDYPEFHLEWQETFAGDRGTLPNRDNWKIVEGDLGINNELQRYTADIANLQLSGSTTLQLVPWKRNGAWTSARIESV